MDLSTVKADLVDDQLREELNACQHFLSDIEMENGRHKVYNFRVAELDSQIINVKLDKVFESLKCVVKIRAKLKTLVIDNASDTCSQQLASLQLAKKTQ